MDQLTQKFQSLTALLASALALSACGGGSGDTQSATSLTAVSTAATTVTETAKVEQSKAAATTLEVPTAIADATGTILTYSSTGSIDHGNLFFSPLGNGRACASCHQESQAWSVTPAQIQARFKSSNGADPIFQLVDGANSPHALVATLAQKQTAYSMLLSKGVIRVGLPIPAGAQFELTQVNDPYGFASAAELSLFRRPLPTANLKYESTIMWDGREVFSANSGNCMINASPAQCFTSINFDLLDQANSAVKGHAQLASGINAAQQQSVVAFESSLFTAQASDNAAGSLSIAGATGGPQNLSSVAFYFGINDFVAGDYQTRARFNPNVMTLFGPWLNNAPVPPVPGTRGAPPPPPGVSQTAQAQASIARGEQIFNTRPMVITGVNGLNDVLNQASFRGSCSTCHDTPAAGTQSVTRLMNTGVAAAVLRTPDMPLYTLKNITTGATVQTTDPGRALITGEWNDVSKFKVPNLRGLAARAPYFHNGSQPNLAAVVQFYNHRFQMGLSPQEANDLTNFLQSL